MDILKRESKWPSNFRRTLALGSLDIYPVRLEHRMVRFCKWLFTLGSLTVVLSLMPILNVMGQSPGWVVEVEKALEAKDQQKAIALMNQVVAQSPESAPLLHMRGTLLFRLGMIQESLKDFDASIKLDPRSAPYDWQRGIALYYGDRFAEGREQFELHRKVNPNDVENSVWHFLCVAKTEGLEAARKVLIPSAGDARPPMMEILKLFHGESTPEKVIELAESQEHGPKGLALAQFYGYLYLGLYFDSLGQLDVAEKWLKKATEQETGGYMADVARVHLQMLEKSKKNTP